MSEQIILYDIPSKLPWKAWSPNTWKTRFALSYKGLPFRTEWIEYPDIAPTAKKMGCKPSSIGKDGSPMYTVPFIFDQSTGQVIHDSTKIALYLEATYPNTPKLFPAPVPETNGWLLGTHNALHDAIRRDLPSELWDFVRGSAYSILNPASQAFYRKREALGGKEVEEFLIAPGSPERLKLQESLKEGLDSINSWYSDDRDLVDGPWLGKAAYYSGFRLGAHLMWIKSTLGDDSEEWRIIISHNGGRWAKLMDALAQYSDLS